MRHWPPAVAVIASILLLICDSVTFGQFRFSVTPIGGDLYRTGAVAINDGGAVIGRYGFEETLQSFLWTPGSGLQLLPSPAGVVRAAAVDISNAGVVLGSENGAQVWTWENGQVHLIPSLAGSAVSAINSAGQIAGYDADANVNIYRPFRWQNGQKTPLLTTEPINGTVNEGITTGMNEGGDIAGWVRGTAAIWLADGSQVPFAGNSGAYASDISDQTNCVVGSNGHRAIFWRPPVVPMGMGVDMGDHPASIGTGYQAYHAALAVNTVCHAVGFAEVNSAEDQRAFFWTADEGMMDLNALLDASGEGWVLEMAADINNSDQIVGYGKFNGEQRAFLLTPVQVPEPMGAAAALLVVMGMIPRRKRAPASN